MDRVDRRKCEYVLSDGAWKTVAVGEQGMVSDTKCMMGFMTVAKALGDNPVRKGMTSFYVEKARNARILTGRSEDALSETAELGAGNVLVLGEDEYFQFAFDAEDGYASLVFFTPA